LRESLLTVDVIRQRLQEENVNLASGVLREGDREFVVRTLNEFRSVDEIRELILEARGDRLIRLSDVARVHRTDKEPDVITRIDGRPSVEIAIFKENSSNIVEVAHAIKAALFGPAWQRTLVAGTYDASREPQVDAGSSRGGRGGDSDGRAALRLATTLPPGLGLRVLSDQSTFIESSIAEVQQSGVYGAFFAIVVLLVFLRSMRSTLIIAASIPISIIATFGPMMQFGVSLNVMSLGGLALGIGMLVDASIVVLESIDRCVREGDSIRLASLRGTREVASAVVASVLTTVAVFFPIVFVEGVAGEIFKDQSLTVVFSLLASLAVALFFIPMLSGRAILPWLGDFFVMAPTDTGESRMQRGLNGMRDSLTNAVTGWSSLKSAHASMIPAPEWGVGRTILHYPSLIILLPFHLLFFALEVVGRLIWIVAIQILALVCFPLALLFSVLRLLLRPFSWFFDTVYSGVEGSYRLLLQGALQVRLLVVVAAVGLGFLAAREARNIGLDLIPEMHSGEIIIELPQPVGTSLLATSKIARRAEERLAGDTDIRIEGFSTIVGVARDEIAPPGEGPHTAKIHVLLPLVPDMARAEADAVDAIRRDLAMVPEISRVEFSAPRLITFANPLEIQIKGEQLERIENLGRLLGDRLAAAGFLEDVQTTIQEGSPEFVIRYDRVRLAERG
ncbi:MAG: efflux RND transporter permease subunit, partial [Planctomycetes bacterium]|nr:efflux RND transporter permease subunit [Planctomycetota bacterium]